MQAKVSTFLLWANNAFAVSVRAESNDMPSGDVRNAFFGDAGMQIAVSFDAFSEFIATPSSSL
eukprot:9745250-Karenia_brevis.AAC.1